MPNNVTKIGTTFKSNSQWHTDELALIETVVQQIDQQFSDSSNLFINTTWFGPQFNNHEYETFLKITSDTVFDNLFLMAAADPVFLNHDQIADVYKKSGATKLFLLGHFDSDYYFNFHSQVIPKYFKEYSVDEIKMTAPDYLFLNYNRKSRGHRIDLIEKLHTRGLLDLGVYTLGKPDSTYSGSIPEYLVRSLNEEPDEGNWDMDIAQFGIAHDIHTLGRLDIWQTHFLTVVSETEFNPWDNMFISEKTWKPILGLRPFILNGQPQVYKYLRDNGFKTFNHYWPHIDIENSTDITTHDNICDVVEYLSKKTKTEIIDMYTEMLPDLFYNRERFFEYSKEQNYKMNHLFA